MMPDISSGISNKPISTAAIDSKLNMPDQPYRSIINDSGHKKSYGKKAHRQQGIVVNRCQPQRGDGNHQPQREQQNHRRTLAAKQQVRTPSGEQRAQ